MNRPSLLPLLKKNRSDQTSTSPLENLYQGEINLRRKDKEDLNDLKDLFREILENNQPVDYDKEDVKLIEERIMKEQEMFEISEVNSIKEDTFKEPKQEQTEILTSNSVEKFQGIPDSDVTPQL